MIRVNPDGTFTEVKISLSDLATADLAFFAQGGTSVVVSRRGHKTITRERSHTKRPVSRGERAALDALLAARSAPATPPLAVPTLAEIRQQLAKLLRGTS